MRIWRTTQKGDLTTQKEEIATQKSESATQKPLNTTQNAILNILHLVAGELSVLAVAAALITDSRTGMVRGNGNGGRGKVFRNLYCSIMNSQKISQRFRW